MKAEPFDPTGALTIVDRTQGGLYDALGLLDMMDAIARLCEKPDTNVSKDDLRSIYRGLTVVIERLKHDITRANNGVSELWELVRGTDHTGGAQ